MNLRHSLVLAAVSMWAGPQLAQAGSLECQGTIISQGDSAEQLLQACGEPTSRQGTDWRYEIPGSLPQVVTVGEGVVMFIRDADQVQDSPASPLGDHL